MGQEGKISAALLVSVTLVVCILAGAVYGISSLLSSPMTEHRKRQTVQTVTLLKPPPPPPPKVKEKEPEPEVKKEVMQNDVQTAQPQDAKDEPAGDDKPEAGDQLGVDATGGAGSDGFGLVGKKGGRSIVELGTGTGSGSRGGGLMGKYAWYTSMIQEEIKKRVRKRLEDGGGIPKGKMQAVVRIVMDEKGNIREMEVVGSSGNHRMDEAVRETLAATRIQEPPPDGMPRSMKLRITAQG